MVHLPVSRSLDSKSVVQFLPVQRRIDSLSYSNGGACLRCITLLPSRSASDVMGRIIISWPRTPCAFKTPSTRMPTLGANSITTPGLIVKVTCWTDQHVCRYHKTCTFLMQSKFTGGVHVWNRNLHAVSHFITLIRIKPTDQHLYFLCLIQQVHDTKTPWPLLMQLIRV